VIERERKEEAKKQREERKEERSLKERRVNTPVKEGKMEHIKRGQQEVK
jgi:hypothetical protein